MASIDYMKVLDIIALTLDMSSQYKIQAADLTIFNAVLSRPGGFKTEITIKIYSYDLEIYLKKNIFIEKDFDKWLNIFEFQLEQVFFKNIALTQSETKTEYRIKIAY